MGKRCRFKLEVAALEGELWDVRNRVSFILDYIDTKQKAAQ